MPTLYKDGKSQVVDPWMMGSLIDAGWSYTPAPRNDDLASVLPRFIGGIGDFIGGVIFPGGGGDLSTVTQHGASKSAQAAEEAGRLGRTAATMVQDSIPGAMNFQQQMALMGEQSGNAQLLRDIQAANPGMHDALVEKISPTWQFDENGQPIFRIQYAVYALPGQNLKDKQQYTMTAVSGQPRLHMGDDTTRFQAPAVPVFRTPEYRSGVLLGQQEEPEFGAVEVRRITQADKIAAIFGRTARGENVEPGVSAERQLPFLDDGTPNPNAGEIRNIQGAGALDQLTAMGLPDSDIAGLFRNAFNYGAQQEAADRPSAGSFPGQFSYGQQNQKNIQRPVDPNQALLDLLAALASGGRGGGYAKPKYVAPDRNAVRDEVKGKMIQLVGRSDGRIEALTNLYMGEHRKAFDGGSTDPGQKVLDRLRSFDDYRAIHKLRPEGIDESQWVTTQQQGLAQSGVRAGVVDERAIIQAQIGTSAGRSGAAARLTEFEGTGRTMPGFFQSFQQAAAQALRRVS